MTRVVETIAEMRSLTAELRCQGECIGLVPTMGALHDGHLSLITRARAECDRVAVSLFVNPIQFNQAADLASYPRTLEADRRACEQAAVDWLFAPAADEMYPSEPCAYVEVEQFAAGLCGAHRPGHFRGVTTVVAKLFHIVQPDRAYFGEKDYQQLAVIRRMAHDLDFSAEVVGCPIVREPDGLALSSRNARLTPEGRRAALALHRALSSAQTALHQGEADAGRIRAAALAALDAEPLARVEYAEVVDAETLEPLERVEREARIALAVWIDEVRLIDNAPLTP